MIISHDREFLDRTTLRTWEVRNRKITEYAGNYTDYMRAHSKEQLKENKLFEEQQDFLKSEKALINRFRAGSRAGFAKSRERQLEKVEVLEKPVEDFKPVFLWSMAPASSEKVLFLKEVFIGRDEPLFYINELTLHS